jgi:hypothetical protein
MTLNYYSGGFYSSEFFGANKNRYTNNPSRFVGCYATHDPTISQVVTPVITSQPQDVTINLGDNTNLSVTATASGFLTYQWYVGTSGDTANPIGGATNNVVNVAPIVDTPYWVMVTNNGLFSVNSNTATVSVSATAISAAISGTIFGATPQDIVAGGKTIIITLTNDTWVTAGAAFDAVRQDIINGLNSNGAEPAGWNASVRALESVTSVVRTSDSIVTITLTAATYSITAAETITTTVPTSAMVIGPAVVGAPTFTLSPSIAPSDVITDQASNWQADYWKHRTKKQRKRDEDEERIRLGILPPELRQEADEAVAEAAAAAAEYAAGHVEAANALAVAMQARQEYEDIYKRAYQDAYIAEVVTELWQEDLRRAKRRRKIMLLLLH